MTNAITNGETLVQLRRIRHGVRATLALGVAASIAANVLHADQNLIAQTIAAWAPLALLLSVELISRVPVHRRAYAAARLAATIIIAGIAAWVSYWHMVAVASRYGESGLTPYLLPISVDGLIVVASISLVEVGGRIRTHRGDTGTTGDRRGRATPPPGISRPTTTPEAGLPAALVSQARLVAGAHHRATGTTITPADLAGRMRLTTTQAEQLLATIAQPAPVNGTPAPTGAHRQETHT